MSELFQHYHLVADREGDTITLSQSDLNGNEDRVVLHVSQIRQIAASLDRPESVELVHAQPTGDPDEMHSIAVEEDADGTVTLYQTRSAGMGGCDERVELHPIQAAWLAAKLTAIISNGAGAGSSGTDCGGTDLPRSGEA